MVLHYMVLHYTVSPILKTAKTAPHRKMARGYHFLNIVGINTVINRFRPLMLEVVALATSNREFVLLARSRYHH
jgi:hypothetical protein